MALFDNCTSGCNSRYNDLFSCAPCRASLGSFTDHNGLEENKKY